MSLIFISDSSEQDRNTLKNIVGPEKGRYSVCRATVARSYQNEPRSIRFRCKAARICKKILEICRKDDVESAAIETEEAAESSGGNWDDALAGRTDDRHERARRKSLRKCSNSRHLAAVACCDLSTLLVQSCFE